MPPRAKGCFAIGDARPGSRPLFARTVLVDGDVTVVVDLPAHSEQRCLRVDACIGHLFVL